MYVYIYINIMYIYIYTYCLKIPILNGVWDGLTQWRTWFPVKHRGFPEAFFPGKRLMGLCAKIVPCGTPWDFNVFLF